VKTRRSTLNVLLFVLLVSMACSISQARSTNPVVQTSSVPPEATPYLQVTSDASSGREGAQYWKGAIPDSYYMLDSHGVPIVEMSGIPWMMLTYDKISGDITSVFFGMSEVTYKILDDKYSAFEYSDPDVDAGTLPKELGLTGWVWNEAAADGDQINMGVQQFSFVWFNCERWVFNYTTDQMTGGVTNLDTNLFTGRQSKTNAFHLYKQ
jgi:hypothetical protein